MDGHTCMKRPVTRATRPLHGAHAGLTQIPAMIWFDDEKPGRPSRPEKPRKTTPEGKREQGQEPPPGRVTDAPAGSVTPEPGDDDPSGERR